MKILICCPLPWVDPKFGASRVALDFVDGLEKNGIEYDFYPPADNTIERLDYPDILADYLIAHAHEYDVVDYPFNVRPWIKDAPNSINTLRVARVVLLPHFEDKTPDPAPPETLTRKTKRWVKKLIGRPEPILYSAKTRQWVDANMHQADLINVANSADKKCLIPLGFNAQKIIVIPYGLTKKGATSLASCIKTRNIQPAPRIAFIGTFDFRKGALDFPEIVKIVADEIPNVRFRLLGTKGMMQTREKVLSWFPKKLHKHLEIHPTFEPKDLPGLLTDCHVGMFPSYREGFGIAVVEMLGAGLPVIAYDVPGPCDILPSDWLIPSGEKQKMAEQLIELLQSDNPAYNQSRALERSQQFDWTQIAVDTINIYKKHLKSKNSVSNS